MKNNYIIILLLSLLFSSCKRDDILPKASQEGNNTFGCLVNGKVWRPKGGRVGTETNLEFGTQNNNFWISTYRILSDDNREYIDLYIIDVEVNELGIYNLNDPEKGTAVFSASTICDYSQHDLTVTRNGTLNITRFDSGIIAGTFEFTLEKPNCETIRVTEGRFDLKF